MPEINSKNVIEQSRTEVHQDDTDQFNYIREHSVSNKDFLTHCKNNDDSFKKLMPLTDLIPTLQEIVEDKKATIRMGRKVLKIIGVIATVLGLLYLIVQIWKEIK